MFNKTVLTIAVRPWKVEWNTITTNSTAGKRKEFTPEFTDIDGGVLGLQWAGDDEGTMIPTAWACLQWDKRRMEVALAPHLVAKVKENAEGWEGVAQDILFDVVGECAESVEFEDSDWPVIKRGMTKALSA